MFRAYVLRAYVRFMRSIWGRGAQISGVHSAQDLSSPSIFLLLLRRVGERNLFYRSGISSGRVFFLKESLPLIRAYSGGHILVALGQGVDINLDSPYAHDAHAHVCSPIIVTTLDHTIVRSILGFYNCGRIRAHNARVFFARTYIGRPMFMREMQQMRPNAGVFSMFVRISWGF